MFRLLLLLIVLHLESFVVCPGKWFLMFLPFLHPALEATDYMLAGTARVVAIIAFTFEGIRIVQFLMRSYSAYIHIQLEGTGFSL